MVILRRLGDTQKFNVVKKSVCKAVILTNLIQVSVLKVEKIKVITQAIKVVRTTSAVACVLVIRCAEVAIISIMREHNKTRFFRLFYSGWVCRLNCDYHMPEVVIVDKALTLILGRIVIPVVMIDLVSIRIKIRI